MPCTKDNEKILLHKQEPKQNFWLWFLVKSHRDCMLLSSCSILLPVGLFSVLTWIFCLIFDFIHLMVAHSSFKKVFALFHNSTHTALILKKKKPQNTVRVYYTDPDSSGLSLKLSWALAMVPTITFGAFVYPHGFRVQFLSDSQICNSLISSLNKNYGIPIFCWIITPGFLADTSNSHCFFIQQFNSW